MKFFKNISFLVLFLLIGSALIAQERCALRLTDATPHSGQYSAYIVIIYDGNYESSTQIIPVTVGITNNIPFNIKNDEEGDVYIIAVYVYEPVTGWQGPYWSGFFNTDDWRNFDIDVTANL